jgi:hypothetical protein
MLLGEKNDQIRTISPKNEAIYLEGTIFFHINVFDIECGFFRVSVLL